MRRTLLVICFIVVMLFSACTKKVESNGMVETTEMQVTVTEAVVLEVVPGVNSENVDEENPFAEGVDVTTIEKDNEIVEEGTILAPTVSEEYINNIDGMEDVGVIEEPKDESQIVSPEENMELSEYEVFQNMSGVDQKAYMESFESIEVFFEWLNKAREEYESGKSSILVGDEVIQLG